MAVVVGITALPACSSLQPSLIRGASQRRAPSLLKTKFMGERLAFAVSAEVSEQNRRRVCAVTAASANGLSNKLPGGLGGMGDPMDFGSSKSKFQEVPETCVSFEDVAGADQSKLELVDILNISRTTPGFTGADLQNWMVDNHGTIDFSANSLVRPILAAAIAGMALVDVEAASAAGGEFGLVEGRSFALIHPIVMGGLFAYTLYAGFLGWQWRRVRTIQTDITELKKQVPKVTVAAGDTSSPPPPPSPIEAQISSLTEERKELVKGGFRDRHFNAGSILLGLGVFESVGGALNTWARTGKLFPGPHLFAGAAITISWAVAASLVPAMQKGNETARNLHIGLNLLNVGLFVWQIPTGWEIVLKVFEFTSWP